jgi:hypothetical protein
MRHSSWFGLWYRSDPPRLAWNPELAFATDSGHYRSAGIDRRQGGMIGKGVNVWSHVHIEDLGCLYMHIVDAAISSCRLYVGRIGVYFAESGECEVVEIVQAVAKELSARGCGGSRPTVFTQAEMEKYTFVTH